MCARPLRPRGTQIIGTSVTPTLCTISPVDDNRPPLMVQLMSRKVILTLLLSFLGFLPRKHVMFQVRGFVTMVTKHRDGRGKRPRSEVSMIPCMY